MTQTSQTFRTPWINPKGLSLTRVSYHVVIYLLVAMLGAWICWYARDGIGALSDLAVFFSFWLVPGLTLVSLSCIWILTRLQLTTILTDDTLSVTSLRGKRQVNLGDLTAIQPKFILMTQTQPPSFYYGLRLQDKSGRKLFISLEAMLPEQRQKLWNECKPYFNKPDVIKGKRYASLLKQWGLAE